MINGYIMNVSFWIDEMSDKEKLKLLKSTNIISKRELLKVE